MEESVRYSKNHVGGRQREKYRKRKVNVNKN